MSFLLVSKQPENLLLDAGKNLKISDFGKRDCISVVSCAFQFSSLLLSIFPFTVGLSNFIDGGDTAPTDGTKKVKVISP